MKEYKCIKPCYIEDTCIAKEGDILKVLPDNHTVVNISEGNQRVLKNITYLLDSEEHFKSITFENTEVLKSDKVNHPSHYTWLKEKCSIEVIDITRHMDFCKGNAVKYLLRAGYKSEEGYSNKQKEIEDLQKAIWYINDRIEQLKKQ